MSYTNLLYHIVYATKKRAPLITNLLRPRLHEYLGGIVRGLGSVPIEINGVSDHVHLLVKLRPTISVSDFLSKLKSNSSGWAKRQTSGRFAWQDRYGAFTVSESQVDHVRLYIRNQEKHHQKCLLKKSSRLYLRHTNSTLMKRICGDSLLDYGGKFCRQLRRLRFFALLDFPRLAKPHQGLLFFRLPAASLVGMWG